MAVSLPNGALIFIASGYGASKTMSAVTNAATAVATLEASHGVVEGDFIEVTSGWPRLNNRIIRAGTVATNDVDLEGFNSTSTSVFPAGSGTGSVREITGWTQLSQILTVSTSGGEQQFQTYQFLEADVETRIPTSKSAAGMELDIADDSSLPGYILASEANDDRLQRAIKIVLPSGAILLYNGYVSINKTPSLTANEVMAVKATISFLNEPTRY